MSRTKLLAAAFLACGISTAVPAQTSTVKRVKAKVGSIEFYPMEARYGVENVAPAGRPKSYQARLHMWVDASDASRITPDAAVNLWRVATEHKDPPYKVEATWYAPDGKTALAAVEFTGDVSTFRFGNPALGVLPGPSDAMAGPSVPPGQTLGPVLYLEARVRLDEANISRHRFTK